MSTRWFLLYYEIAWILDCRGRSEKLALAGTQKESDLDSSMDGNHEAYLVTKIKRFFLKNNKSRDFLKNNNFETNRHKQVIEEEEDEKKG